MSPSPQPPRRPSADALALTAEQVERYIDAAWPGGTYEMTGKITHLSPGSLRYHHPTSDADLRPGGTVSGPTMMTVADSAAYALVVAHLGDGGPDGEGNAALAVTSHLSIEFLRRPEAGELIADAELLKLGRSSITMWVRISDAQHEVAAATVIYSRALSG